MGEKYFAFWDFWCPPPFYPSGFKQGSSHHLPAKRSFLKKKKKECERNGEGDRKTCEIGIQGGKRQTTKN